MSRKVVWIARERQPLVDVGIAVDSSLESKSFVEEGASVFIASIELQGLSGKHEADGERPRTPLNSKDEVVATAIIRTFEPACRGR